MSAAVGWVARRALVVTLSLGCIATPAALIWPSGSAAAATPFSSVAGSSLSITSPESGATVQQATPTIEGESSDRTVPPPPIKVSIYKLPIEAGAEPIGITAEQKFAGFPWSANVKTPLLNGEYKAVAEQTQGIEKVSAEVTFTVDAPSSPPSFPSPHVAIAYPLSGSSSAGGTQLLSGSASTGSPNAPQVTVEVFPGTTPTPPALRSLSVPVGSGGLWNGTVGGLSPGTYTAVAVQQGDREGRSTPVTFTLTGPAAGPAMLPAASFTWFPAAPAVGQNVVLVSTSTDLTSPITTFAWDLLGTGTLNAGGPVISTAFAGAGDHVVRLQVADGRGASATASKTIPVSSQPLHPMQPFPIVRIAGVKTSYGVRLSALNVQSPLGARVTVACKGRACKKLKPQSRVATVSASNRRASSVLLSFRGFERPYHAGVTLEVRVFAAGEIGKYTSFAIHRRGLPTREDQCLSALDPHPIPCPA
jgi:PKD domain